MDAVIVGEPKHFDEGGKYVVSAPVVLGADCHEVWYQVAEGPLARGAETFLAAALTPAMKVGGGLHLTGTVSPRLSASIPKIQDIFHTWYPDFKKVAVDVETKRVQLSPSARGVGCFFSGGVDSFYTLLKHKEEITKLIFVHGFDIRLDDIPLRAKVSQVLREVAFEFRKPLIEVETNVRAFSDRYVGWEEYHGSALASVALLLSPHFRKVYIAATTSYLTLFPWGSHPLLDPLWSTDDMEIVHDGCEAIRIEKVAHISSCDIALKSLRPCWLNPGGAYNCGQCVKCIRTMTALRAVGVLNRCTTFAHTLDLKAVAREPFKRPGGRVIAEKTLVVAERLGADPALVQALRDRLSGRYQRGVWRLALGAQNLLRRLMHRVTNRLW